MAAIVRVKRRLEDVAAPSLLLSCKRIKVSNEDPANQITENADVKSVFKFAGTVQEKDDKVTTSVRQAIRKEKLQKEYKLHCTDAHITSRDHERRHRQQRVQRYSVVAEKRSINLDSLDYSAADEHSASSLTDEQRFRLFDVIPHEKDITTTVIKQDKQDTITCNGVPLERTKLIPGASAAEDDAKYVYDIYYMNKQQFEFSALENIVTVEAYHDDEDFVYGDDEREEYYDDEDDSNDEDNWRNDYPDEDPMFYENEEYEYQYGDDGTDFDKMEEMFSRGLKINRCRREKSAADSDDEDEDTYYRPQINPTDLWAPTTSYDSYKAKVKMQLNMDS